MAEIPQGPGQPETIKGAKSNDPGWYKDPESKAIQHVGHPAGADALVRMGWQKLPDGPNPNEQPAAAEAFIREHSDKPAQEAVSQPTPAQPAAAITPADQQLPEAQASNVPEEEKTEQSESADNAVTGEEDASVAGDSYKETTLANGSKRYYKNGVQISKEDYDAAVGSTPTETPQS